MNETGVQKRRGRRQVSITRCSKGPRGLCRSLSQDGAAQQLLLGRRRKDTEPALQAPQPIKAKQV